MESTPEESTPAPVSAALDDTEDGHAEKKKWSDRRKRFTVFICVAVATGIVSGILAYQYQKQDAAIAQLRSFVSVEALQRQQSSESLNQPEAQAFLAEIETGTPEWDRILDERDSRREEARQNAIDQFPKTGWFPNLDAELEKVADESFGTREELEESLRVHAVGIFMTGCNDLKADPAAGIPGALEKYDDTISEFYGDLDQTNHQMDSTTYFRDLLEESLRGGCPDISGVGTIQSLGTTE